MISSLRPLERPIIKVRKWKLSFLWWGFRLLLTVHSRFTDYDPLGRRSGLTWIHQDTECNWGPPKLSLSVARRTWRSKVELGTEASNASNAALLALKAFVCTVSVALLGLLLGLQRQILKSGDGAPPVKGGVLRLKIIFCWEIERTTHLLLLLIWFLMHGISLFIPAEN